MNYLKNLEFINSDIQCPKLTLNWLRNFKLNIFFVIFFLSLFGAQDIFSEIYVPMEEYLGYFDSNGIYTVVGNVKNTNDYAVIPTISIFVKDDFGIKENTIKHVPLAPSTEIPFKVKFPELVGNEPTLLDPDLKFEKTTKEGVSIKILYDDTLKQHSDGHITGKFQNVGNKTVQYPKIFAVIHGHDSVLDISQNIEFVEKIEPGETLDFSIYPDPSITKDVFYYSCFAPVDTTVIPITAKKNDGNYNFRYDSGAWYQAAKFNDEGTVMTIQGYNSYPLDTYANFEFPPISGNEKFVVLFNDEPIKFIQSKDELGFWHVAFNVGPTSQGTITISGFDSGLPPELSKIPAWVKTNASWWSSEQISDSEFLEGIDFLFNQGIIFVAGKQLTVVSSWKIPPWLKAPSKWWSEEKISEDEFLNLVENLVVRKIIII